MTQNVLDYSQNPSGNDLMDVFLAGMAENQLTNHSGTSRPTYAKAGTFWIDTTISPWVLKQFTGSDDVILGTLDQTNLMFTARRALQDGSGNVITSTYLPVNGTAARATADGNGNVITNTYLPVGGTAARATADASGNNIKNTYATKTELDQKSSFKLFHHDWFDYQLNDQSWLRADTFSWQPATTQYGTYLEAYNHLVDDYNNGTSQTETIGSYTITYKLASDGHKICLPDQETTVANIYNESGVAWYYILDTTNQRFKLPRENPAREELIQIVRAKGNGKAVTFTDGTNSGGTVTRNMAGVSGSATVLLHNNYINTDIGTSFSTDDTTWGNAHKTVGITTNSTESGIISNMTDSTSVYKGKQYLYFYVGQYSQSATEQTAGLNTELFNGKMDRDMSNMNPSTIVKKTIVSWGMPDYTAGVSVSYTDLNAGYEAPYDGVLLCSFGLNGTVSINSIVFTVNLEGNNKIIREIHLNKGDVIKTSNQTSGYAGTNMFFPLKGV